MDLSKLTDEQLEAYLYLKMKDHAPPIAGPQVPQELQKRPEGARVPLAAPSGLQFPNGPSDMMEFGKRGAAGTVGTVLGGGLGGLLGIVSPPETKGDWAGMLAGGAASKALAPLTRIPGAVGTLASGAAGVGSNAASLGARSMAGDDVTGTEAGISSTIAGLLPMLTRGLIRTPAANSPTGNARKSLAQLLGKEVEPSQAAPLLSPATSAAAGKPILSPYGKAFNDAKGKAGLLQEAENQALQTGDQTAFGLRQKVSQIDETNLQQRGKLASILRKNRRELGKAQSELDNIDQNTIKDLKPSQVMDEAAVEELRSKISEQTGNRVFTEAERDAATKQFQAAKTGALRVPEGPLKLNVENQAVETLKNNLVQNKMARMKALTDAQEYEKLELPNLKKTVSENPAVSPELRHFTDVSNVDDFYKQVEKATPSNFIALRETMSPQATKEFEEGFSKHFAKLAVGPDGTFSNIAEATKTFDYDKIAAAYGGGVVGRAKADMFKDITQSTLKLLENNKKYDVKNRIGMAAASSLPFIVLHAASGGSLQTMALKAGAAAATTFVAVSLPKIIDKAVSDPRFGKEFQKWATEDATAAALKKFPVVERFFHSENVNKEKTPGE